MKAEILQERLLARARSQQFGHFYLFSGKPEDLEAQKNWVQSLIRRYWTEIEGRSQLPSDIRSDADLLWIAPPLNDDDEVVDYKVEGIEQQLATFLPYRGLKSKRRFVIIEEAHRLTTIISNKLLKTLEEPEGELSFIWLNPLGKKFLPTIESRALNLKLSWPVSNNSIGATVSGMKGRFIAGDYPLAEFLEHGKKGEFDAYELLDEMLNLERIEPGNAAYQQELLILVKEWDEAERFNQSIAPRLQSLHYLLSKRFSDVR